MKIKRGASIKGCRAEILYGAILIEPLFSAIGVEFVFTEGTNGKHSVKRSSHYRGDGIDVRSNTVPLEQKNPLLTKIKRKLGPDYVAILESPGKPYEHFHIHWSPVYHD